MLCDESLITKTRTVGPDSRELFLSGFVETPIPHIEYATARGENEGRHERWLRRPCGVGDHPKRVLLCYFGMFIAISNMAST